MLYNQSICLLLALCWCALHAQPDAQPSTPLTGDFREIGSARLVVHKHLLSQYAVQDKEVVVEYTLYNIGDKPATRVSLDDRHSFATQYFAVLAGTLHARWPRIDAGANVTHSVVLRPLEVGAFNVSAAVISYRPGDSTGDDEQRHATSSAPGEIYIYKLRDYERKFSPHYIDWVIFFLMASPCIGLPAVLWFQTYKKYDLLAQKKTK